MMYCTSYADENKYIFIGQNGNEGNIKAAFILELLENDSEQIVQINENGEVYLKVDKIIAVPKETFSQFANFSSNLELANFLTLTSPLENYIELEVRCPKCGFYYHPRPGFAECPRPICKSSK